MLPTLLTKLLLIIISYVKWAMDFLLRHSLFPSSTSACSLQMISEMQTVCVSDPNAAVDSNECAVCLCRIVAGDEISRLRCSHVFHRVCFNRWVGYGRRSCPLCRNHARDSESGGLDDEEQLELVIFNFAQVNSWERKDSWWLR